METPEPPAVAGFGDDDRDRLSALPDCLLVECVLSRLTTWQAARTSALSRRWRRLWRAVPRVDIDHRELRTTAPETGPKFVGDDAWLRRWIERLDDLEHLADRLLPPPPDDPDAPPLPPLDAVRLRFACEDYRAARMWVRRGLARRPVAFHLLCDNDTPHSYLDDRHRCFPQFFLHRHHLGTAAAGPASRLRTLHVAGLSLAPGFADDVATAFPVLEDLRLESCEYHIGRLASRSLQSLSMDRCFREVGELALAAPRLASLHIDAAPLTLEGESSVVAASLVSPAGDLGVLRSLRHARSLELFGFSTTALLDGGGEDADPGGFPVFGDLRTLVLDRCDVGVECQVLRRFLRNAPNLETLTLRSCEFSSSGGSSSRSRKRKRRSHERSSSAGPRSPVAYPCKKLRSIELEFGEGRRAVSKLADALVDISKEMVQPIEGSLQDGMGRVKISYK